MKFLFDAYMVLSYTIVVGLGIALVRDGDDTRYDFWAYAAAVFWPVTVTWMVISFLIEARRMEE